jgi:hypothetical protein
MNELIGQIKQWGIDKGIVGPNGKGTLLGQLSKTPTEESTSAYLDMEMAGRQIAEAKESWREDSMEWTFLTLCDAENTIQSAKAKVGRVLQYQHNETSPFVDATEMKL